MHRAIARRTRPALPGAIKRHGKLLLNQQCWLWGQDVKKQEDNLLLRHGFERLRPPQGIAGSSQYAIVLADGLKVKLWGFGIFIGREEGVFLNRFDFFPRQAADFDLWQAHRLSSIPRAQDFSLLPRLARWIAEYEDWVLRTGGVRYRASCLDGWKRRTKDPAQVPSQWMTLAMNMELFLSSASEGIDMRSVVPAIPPHNA